MEAKLKRVACAGCHGYYLEAPDGSIVEECLCGQFMEDHKDLFNELSDKEEKIKFKNGSEILLDRWDREGNEEAFRSIFSQNE